MSPEETPPLPSAAELRTAACASVKLRLLPGRHSPRYAVPLRCGVPLPPGKLTAYYFAWVIGPTDEVLPVQTHVLSTWADGSARWVLIDVLLSNFKETPTVWTVVFSTLESMPASPQGQTTDCLEPAGEFPPEPVFLPGPDAGRRADNWSLPEITSASGETLRSVLRSVSGRRQGLICQTRVESIEFPQLRGLTAEVRVTEYHSAGLLRADLTLRNSRRAKHRGGLWDLGDDGSILFQSLQWNLDLIQPGPNRVAFQPDPGSAWCDSTPAFSIQQESSGGEHWNSVNHVDRFGMVPWQDAGYKARTPEKEIQGRRAAPSVRIAGPGGCGTATMPCFWQQFPKSLAATADDAGGGITFGFFPPQAGRLYELQGGEQITHTIWLKIDPPGADLEQADLSWVHDPPRLVPVVEDQPVVPGWPRLSRLDAAPISRLDALCDEALNGPASVYVRREEIDEYGWRNFGEFFADHETVYYKGAGPLISHYNNQYDVLGGLLLQGLRTEDRRWFELAEASMRHITDIDLYHTDEDRAVFNGGLFWLTDHYSSCGTATHRCFSNLNAKPGQPYGGGPACEHNYTTGLLAYYWLTGEPAAKDAVVQLANWVIAMDDGRNTVLGLIDDGPAGYATATAEADYHGPGRGAGNSINALLDAWLLTGDRTYLAQAEAFIRRCIHPADDIAARDLLNFELRWSYTVFLMAAFKYLECKAEIREFDAGFEYARQSLLHYARWMADHERPYFDRAEQMEFPTETWGAQELRKANVFRGAARYADEPLRARLIQKGNEFAERAWHDLCRFPTRTFIRPFALVMIQGVWDAALRGGERPVEDRGPQPESWGEPTDFVPQKTRVKRMLKSPRGIARAVIRALDPRRWRPFGDALRRMR